ncbi:2OG-Fe(II) oxygenase [Ralstonia syzygii]|uniref:Putative Prolyl 4-hydroxylase alpha subunit n=1 Tax=Ralstonia syzygii R24 TaxID=907261 RepID=G3AAG6_9RALS|nr:2OG-Fe(II) oxygenase [Ralstonia syzygii]CCA88057.1 putative Prolyl 4-hydroxylase alpha subunit [Ralstonia syzygii R24]
MTSVNQECRSDLAMDEIENWLKQAVNKKGCTPEIIANAMVSDGHNRNQATILAASAFLRYGRVPLTAVLHDSASREAMLTMRAHVGAAFEAHQQRQAIGEMTAPVFDPRTLEQNRLCVGDRQVSVQFVSHHPRAALISDLLSTQECDALIEQARSRLTTSYVIEYESGQEVVNEATRSCSCASFPPEEMSMLQKRIVERAARLVGQPGAHCEGVTFARYLPGEQFRPHVDYFRGAVLNNDKIMGSSGHRIATVLLYLNEVEAGGATFFPNPGFEVRPQKGGALYFAYQQADGSMDPTSLHEGCAVTQGEKWIATLWFRERVVVADAVTDAQ